VAVCRLLPPALVILACAPATPSRSAVVDQAELTATITTQFAKSAEAWNRGDLDAFVSDYANDSLTSFVSGGHLQRGYGWIREHYQPRFLPGATRDSLRFEEFNVRPLAPDVALVTARYVLYRGGQTAASGPFTLILERRPEGWKILHDHTSSD
jgi:beta-aspartyl-peptidase (threonine type)